MTDYTGTDDDAADEPLLSPQPRVIWPDGTVWFLDWMQEFDGYYAERWYDPDDFEDDDDLGHLRDCPGPEEGIFASLDAIEVAMGEQLPQDVWLSLELESALLPCIDHEAWGVAFAAEVHHLLVNGTIVTTWAPAWADDPLDPRWEIDTS